MTPEQYRDSLAAGLAAGTPAAELWRHARAFVARGLVPRAWCEDVLGPEPKRGAVPAAPARAAPAPAPAPRPAAAPRRTLPCVHLGDVVGEQRCPTCTGHVIVKRFACSVYGQTTLGKKLDGVQCCVGCPDYEPKG